MTFTTALSSLLSLVKTPIGTGSWAISLFLIFLAANIKNLPFVWHLRFLRTLTARLLSSTSPHKLTPSPSPSHLFLPAITTSRSPLLECDYNIHKSNSTYFSDLDISRTNLLLLLFRSKLTGPSKNKLVPMLGGVQCSFKREIKPYQGYEMWTRVLSWDEKWVYLVSHLVEKGKVRPREYVLQGGKNGDGKGKAEQKYVLASSIARYVFKSGRKTVPPWNPLVDCNLLPQPPSLDGGVSPPDLDGDTTDTNETWEKIEGQRKRDLEMAQLKSGWDAIHELFSNDGEVLALGRYTDLLWR